MTAYLTQEEWRFVTESRKALGEWKPDRFMSFADKLVDRGTAIELLLKEVKYLRSLIPEEPFELPEDMR